MATAGGPNIERDGLVFGYDTGANPSSNFDHRITSRRYFKGKNTTNLQPSGVAFGHNSGTYGNVVTVVDAPEKGQGWKKVTINNRGSNFRIIQWTYTSMTANTMYCHSIVFDWGNMRDKGYYINHDGTGTGQRFFYKPGDYVTNQGASISINSTLVDGKIAGNITHTASHTHAFFINNNTTGVSGLNDYFYYRDYQVEQSAYPTPYSSGTRSATQSLLDLTKSTNIDVSNVSFDSDGLPTFDGTDDYISLGDDSRFDFTNGVFSIEAIVKFPSSWTAGGQYPNLISKGASAGWDTDGWALFGFRDWPSAGQKSWGLGFRNGATSRTVYIANRATDVYLHIVATADGSTMRLYENGVQVSTQSQTINPASNSTNVYIGRGPGSVYFPGDIPVAKIYNQTLTATEVLQNYKAYKNRFNI